MKLRDSVKFDDWIDLDSGIANDDFDQLNWNLRLGNEIREKKIMIILTGKI